MNPITLQAFIDELKKIASLPQLIERGIQRSRQMGRMPFIPLRGAAAKGMEIAKKHGIEDVRGLSHIAQHTTVPEGNILHMLGKGVTNIPDLQHAATNLERRTADAAKFAPVPSWKPGQSGVRDIVDRSATTARLPASGHTILQRQAPLSPLPPPVWGAGAAPAAPVAPAAPRPRPAAANTTARMPVSGQAYMQHASSG